MSKLRPAFLVAILAAAVGLAACTDPGRDVGSSDTGPRSPDGSVPQGAPSSDTRFIEPVQPGNMIASQCSGWDSRQIWPGDPPRAGPTGWDSIRPIGGSVTMQALDCKRINFAGLERGPIQMVLEFTSLVVPRECGEANRSTNDWALYSWGITDEDLARLLHERLGAPTYVINYTWNDGPAPGGNLADVQWGPSGQAQSALQIYHGIGSRRDSGDPDRHWWQNGTGVVAFDVTFDSVIDGSAPRAGVGTIQPPMRMAEAYANYVGPTNWYQRAEFIGLIYSWSDLECKHPSGSQPS